MKHISSFRNDLSQLPTSLDLSSDKFVPHLPKLQLEKKFTQQPSRNSLDDHSIQAKSDQTTTQNGPLTQRTDPNSLAYPKPSPRSVTSKFSQHCFQAENQQNHVLDSKKARSNNLQKLKMVMVTISKISNSVLTKMLGHLSKMSTADKYIRLFYSILKLYRALHEKNNLGLISKELLTARRVIQWESKYQLIQQLKNNELSAFDFGYKIFELVGNLLDFGSFWIQLLGGENKKWLEIYETLYAWQDDCYFYQCSIELIFSIKNLVKNLKLYRSESDLQPKRFQNLHKIAEIRECGDKLQQKFSRMKGLCRRDGPKQQVSKIFEQRITQKINEKERECADLEKRYEDWRQIERKKVRKEIIKSIWKIIKYICDVRTSFNNYSGKEWGLDPVVGGGLSVISSMFSMSLIWNF